MGLQKTKLRKLILQSFKDQGFKMTKDEIKPAQNTKNSFRKLQQISRLDHIKIHSKFLKDFLPIAKDYARDGDEINPENIKLEFREIVPRSLENDLFKWWNFIWWSTTYQPAYGRRMRFILWDKGHDAPFGFVNIQSPLFALGIRDNYLQIKGKELGYWNNLSMNAQRVGALPPYNDLLGGKMVSMSLASKEIKDAYKKKYDGRKTIIQKRTLSADLLFITTTSAFGKSSIYDRLKFNKQLLAKSLGYTEGFGSFHIQPHVYKEIINYLQKQNICVDRTFGSGSSRKARLFNEALKMLELPNYSKHGIKREFFIFPHVKNLHDVIHNASKPKWLNYKFKDLEEFWKIRWCLPRAERNKKWKSFKKKTYFNQSVSLLNHLTVNSSGMDNWLK